MSSETEHSVYRKSSYGYDATTEFLMIVSTHSLSVREPFDPLPKSISRSTFYSSDFFSSTSSFSLSTSFSSSTLNLSMSCLSTSVNLPAIRSSSLPKFSID